MSRLQELWKSLQMKIKGIIMIMEEMMVLKHTNKAIWEGIREEVQMQELISTVHSKSYIKEYRGVSISIETYTATNAVELVQRMES